MDIRILPANIANMIAAGEVVQRPASVVKELMENSVDAGATRVDVIVVDAGRTLIQVIDNGCGMTPDQAVLCFQRHATSKIATAEDLEAIETYGFRGEALASIAAVAEVVLKTRTADSDVAVQVSITDATAEREGRQDVREVAAPVGSNFAVSNLFYNTPARRKFLKSDASELKQIISEFIRMALSRTDIAFNLTASGRDIFRLPPAKGLLFRIKDIFGSSASDELVSLDNTTTVARVGGFVSGPSSARKSGVNQFFFVNGRFFRSPYLHKAVMKAYENLIPEGTSPSYFIYLDVDPHTVDINVHPTKTEIKFEDDNVLFTVLMASVREALGRETFVEPLDFEAGALQGIRNVSSSFSEFKPVSEPSFGDGSFNPFDGDGFPNEKGWDVPSGYHGGSYQAKPSLGAGELDMLLDREASRQQEEHPDVLVSGRYIIRPSRSGFMLVDAQRAMQRVLYEDFIEALSHETPVSQMALFPLEVEVGAQNIPLLEQNAELLSRMGFVFSPFSANTILVNGLPAGLTDDKMSVFAMVYEIVTALGDERQSISNSVYATLAEKMSLSSARAAVLPKDAAMARNLLDRLYGCENPEFTSDGRRIVSVLDADALDKLLK